MLGINHMQEQELTSFEPKAPTQDMAPSHLPNSSLRLSLKALRSPFNQDTVASLLEKSVELLSEGAPDLLTERTSTPY